MIVFKLIIITLFIYFSSKSFGTFIIKKFNLPKELSFCLGYFFNLTIYFLLTFMVMLLNLSSSYLMIVSLLYIILCIYFIYYAIREKELFKFSKKEIFAICIAFCFSLLFAFFVDFGFIEMYDSYFYSVFTNSATNADSISIINPYTGYPNMQNYYKYISVYYQASFFAKIFGITPAYLVLIWPFTFINYLILSSTSLSFVRIAKKSYFNNILTIFLLTFFTSFFRAPFNSLYMINIVFPLYLIYFAFYSFKEKNNIFIYYMLFIAATACSSVIFYVSAILVYILFIVNCINKKADFLTVFKLAIPTYLLGVLYVFSGTKNILIIVVSLIILVLVYFFIKTKISKKIIKICGLILMIAIPIMFVLFPKASFANNIINIFTTNKKIWFDDIGLQCINGNINTNLDFKVDMNILSTSMNYIYEGNNSFISSLLIILTHSIVMYGGLLFFLIYGFIKFRKSNYYLAFIIYLVTFYNPLVSMGLSNFIFEFNDRIYLFFNTFFAMIGLKCFFDHISITKYDFLNKIMPKLWILYLLFLPLSIISYIDGLKPIDWKNYNFLYKVPNSLVLASTDVNKILNNNSVKNVLYLPEAFNLTLIDENPNNKHKIIDSREFKTFYFDTSILNNKMLLNIYFESNGKIDIYEFVRNNKSDVVNLDNCDIIKLLEYYKVDYIVLGNKNKESFNKISDKYKIIYDKNNVIVGERIGEVK